ncbi:uncharacterized protein TNCV_2813581 [Trichonephila clavipes]|nr:uncharacterized protein TNCV_2813581 [Trichonephila clavipes]
MRADDDTLIGIDEKRRRPPQRADGRKERKSIITHPEVEGEYPGNAQGLPTSLPLSSTSREDLRFDGYLEYPHAAKALYIYKHPCLLRDSNPGPTAQQSVSLTTIPDGWL